MSQRSSVRDRPGPPLPRPALCRKRGCYIKPKSLFPDWDKKGERCDECPYCDPCIQCGEPMDRDSGPMIQLCTGCLKANREAPETWVKRGCILVPNT